VCVCVCVCVCVRGGGTQLLEQCSIVADRAEGAVAQFDTKKR
jgi:hypothetical protein